MKIIISKSFWATSLIVLIQFNASGQLNLWSPRGSLDDYTKEVSWDSTAHYYYEDGLPFNHLYTIHFGREDEIPDEVFHISSKFFPTIKSSASMAFLLYRPYALTASHIEYNYEGNLSEWNGYKKLGIGDSEILSTAIKGNRVAELSILKKDYGVDWFIIITNVEDSKENETYLSYN